MKMNERFQPRKVKKSMTLKESYERFFGPLKEGTSNEYWAVVEGSRGEIEDITKEVVNIPLKDFLKKKLQDFIKQNTSQADTDPPDREFMGTYVSKDGMYGGNSYGEEHGETYIKVDSELGQELASVQDDDNKVRDILSKVHSQLE